MGMLWGWYGDVCVGRVFLAKIGACHGDGMGMVWGWYGDGMGMFAWVMRFWLELMHVMGMFLASN